MAKSLSNDKNFECNKISSHRAYFLGDLVADDAHINFYMHLFRH